jgi:hypothetical protein
MVMTKTEFKKRLVALAIEQLENEFGVEFTGDDEGGRLGFITVAGFRGDFSRRDMEVCLWESIPLSGHGWTPETEVLAQQEAVALENQINEALEAFHMNKDNW